MLEITLAGTAEPVLTTEGMAAATPSADACPADMAAHSGVKRAASVATTVPAEIDVDENKWHSTAAGG